MKLLILIIFSLIFFIGCGDDTKKTSNPYSPGRGDLIVEELPFQFKSDITNYEFSRSVGVWKAQTDFSDGDGGGTLFVKITPS